MVKLNRIALNDKEKLGAKSLAAKDKIVTYDKYLSYATQFNDIVNELNKVTSQEISIRQDLDDFEPILNHVTSDFTFGTNMKIEYKRLKLARPKSSNLSKFEIRINNSKTQFEKNGNKYLNFNKSDISTIFKKKENFDEERKDNQSIINYEYNIDNENTKNNEILNYISF